MAGRISYLGGIVTQGLVLDLDAAKRDSYVGTGTAWNDISGNRNNGTLINGPTFNSGNGGSIVFDGVNDNIQSTNPTNFGSPANITVNVWVKYTNFQVTSFGKTLISATNQAENISFAIYQNTESPYNKIKTFVVVPNGLIVVNSNSQLNTNQWYLVTITYNSSILRIYLNGIFDASAAGTGNIVWPTPTRTPIIGGNAYNSYFAGNISNIQIYNRALSASEVLQNYNATKGRYL